MEVKQRLEQIRDEHKINPPRYVQPMATTSFMVRKSSQSGLRKLPQERQFKKFDLRKKEQKSLATTEPAEAKI
jgi:hypothetical protein